MSEAKQLISALAKTCREQFPDGKVEVRSDFILVTDEDQGFSRSQLTAYDLEKSNAQT